MTKLFVHPSILNIFIQFSESNAHMIPVVFMLISTKKKKINFMNNRLDTINLTGDLCKIGNDKIIRTVENIVLNWLILVSVSNYMILLVKPSRLFIQ